MEHLKTIACDLSMSTLFKHDYTILFRNTLRFDVSHSVYHLTLITCQKLVCIRMC